MFGQCEALFARFRLKLCFLNFIRQEHSIDRSGPADPNYSVDIFFGSLGVAGCKYTENLSAICGGWATGEKTDPGHQNWVAKEGRSRFEERRGVSRAYLHVYMGGFHLGVTTKAVVK